MTHKLNPIRKRTLSDMLMKLFRKSARPEAEEQPPPPRLPLPAQRDAIRRDKNVNPPHNLPKENLTPDERARRIKESNRVYFKAEGMIEAFYYAYPSERPPGRKPEREGDGKGGRGGR